MTFMADGKQNATYIKTLDRKEKGISNNLEYTHTHTDMHIHKDRFLQRTHIDLLLSCFLTWQLYVVSSKMRSDKAWLVD